MVLFFTALSVSIDAYAAGFAYGMTKKLGFFGAVYAGIITFFACLTAGLFRAFFSRNAALVNFVSGVVLVALGVKYMLGKAFEKVHGKEKSVEYDLTALGFFVSVDAAFCLPCHERKRFDVRFSYERFSRRVFIFRSRDGKTVAHFRRPHFFVGRFFVFTRNKTFGGINRNNKCLIEV